MDREEAKKHLHELVDQYFMEEKYDHDSRLNWVGDFLGWAKEKTFPGW